MAEFKPNDKAKEKMPTFADTLSAFAFAQTDEFINAGQANAEAASIVANIMIRTAWIVAATGVVSEGRKPNADNFRAAVEDQLKLVKFNDVEIGGLE